MKGQMKCSEHGERLAPFQHAVEIWIDYVTKREARRFAVS